MAREFHESAFCVLSFAGLFFAIPVRVDGKG